MSVNIIAQYVPTLSSTYTITVQQSITSERTDAMFDLQVYLFDT